VPGAKSVERVAADANVILSAIAGGAALRIFTHTDIKVVTTAETMEEVREYLPRMAKAYRMAPELLEAQLRLLAITEVSRPGYAGSVERATRLMGPRDPDDIALLSLALELDIPVWTNDRDFEVSGQACYSTARLLKITGA